MKVIGLTGGIASGKSTVSNMLKEKGFPIIDADLIAREIIKDFNVINDIVNEFGDEVLFDDGSLNRKFLGNIVFEDENKLTLLNKITHPHIKRVSNERIDVYRQEGERICILDAALLIEANFVDLVDYVLLVYVDAQRQLNRLINRDNLTYDEAINRISSQMSFEEKKKFADYIIDNNKDLMYTQKQVNNILDEILFMEDTNDKKTL